MNGQALTALPPHQRREAAEQARARGLTVEQTATSLDVPAAEVCAVWAAMDAAVLEDEQ